MNPHPMIQPTDWSPESEPDIACRNMPADRAAIYRLVWDSAIACCLKAPALQHHRYIYTAKNEKTVAVAICNAQEDNEGFWQDRQDHPRLPWPANRGTPLPAGEQRVMRVHLFDSTSPTPGQMIEAVADQGIGTPAGLSRLFSALLGGDKNALVEFDHTGLRPVARLTDLGQSRARLWQGAGLVGQASQRSTLADGIASRDIGHRAALGEIARGHANLKPLAEQVARQIDEICEGWRGASQGEAYQAITASQLSEPARRALPAWLDPDNLLSPEHPLRALRRDMEIDLADRHNAWSLMDEAEKGRLRLDWLRSVRPGITDPDVARLLDAALDVNVGLFSALRYWLTGLEST